MFVCCLLVGLFFVFSFFVVVFFTLSHRQNSTYYGLCYNSREVLVRTKNSSIVPPLALRSNNNVLRVSLNKYIASWHALHSHNDY